MRARREGLVCVAIALAAFVAGCAMPEHGGMTRMKADAMAYEQANATCWERGWGASLGGQGETSSRERAYTACMSAMGWQDMRRPF